MKSTKVNPAAGHAIVYAKCYTEWGELKTLEIGQHM